MNDSKTFPRDVFLYLLSIVTLITVSISLGILLYQYINIQFPDLLTEGYYWSKTATFSSIRNSMAVLLVVFPVFVWVSWFLRRDILRNPEKRDLRIRRWLLYLTLFIATLVIIGDLVALLISFLNGELSGRFMLKVLAVLSIAGSIFLHYFSELRDKSFSWMGVFDKIIIVLIAVSVVSGFWIAGSPSQQRAVRFDERRVSDLSSIQYQVIDYWQRKQKLPETLGDLANDINGFIVSKDPETGVDYGYRTTGPLSFELCATFQTEVDDNLGGVQMGGIKSGGTTVVRPDGLPVNSFDGWDHGIGTTCFNRTIDPDYYPPYDRNGKPVPLPL